MQNPAFVKQLTRVSQKVTLFFLKLRIDSGHFISDDKPAKGDLLSAKK